MGCDWYKEDLMSFIYKYELPAYNPDCNIKKFYSLHSKQFLSDFDLMIEQKQHRGHSPDFYQQLKSIKHNIAEGFQTILKIFDDYDKSDFGNTQGLFDKLMKSLIPNLFLTPINGHDLIYPHLYRIRSVKTDEKLKKPNDLFHIPYSRRNLVTNERYSLAGHPCLYLSTYLGIAWEECGFPSQFYYSEFDYDYYKDDWKFITLVSPGRFARILNSNHNGNENKKLDFVRKYLITYPLILACSIVNLSGNSVFKQEYIIPQMLLQWVQRHYGEFHGITYFSCIATDEVFRPNGYNVVIPANDFNRKGYGKNLTKKFKVSKPIYCNNLLSDSAKMKISSYKKDLRQNLNEFPLSAQDCMIKMYDVCRCFDILASKANITDMKLIVLSIKAIQNNCYFIRFHYSKENIISEAEESIFDTDKEKIETFCTFYDRFWKEVEEIISKYSNDLSKITIPDITEFFTVC